MRWFPKTAAIPIGLVSVLAVLLGGIAFGSQVIGADTLFVVESVAVTDRGLQVVVVPNRYGAELAAIPVVVTESGQQQATDVAIQNGRVVLTFDQVTDLGVVASLNLPAISVPLDSSAMATLAAGSFTGPVEHEYRITAIERVVLEKDSDNGPPAKSVAIHVRYEPANDSAPAVSGAMVTDGSATYRTIGLGSTYSANWKLTQGVIRFPVEAEPLLRSGESMLHLKQFRAIESQKIDLNLFLGA